ncbi:MAG: uracil-DNA glycosylase [Firmicutes bacterium]|nr:uracil-DNA glycosylase [Bacillota bacterium]
MAAQIGNDWQALLEPEFSQEYYQNLRKFLAEEYKTRVIYPDMYHIFATLQATPYDKVKVVILGQDPYHGPNQAHGFSFSVPEGVDIPPSLMNIYKELNTDLGCTIPKSGCLTKWADQGVLLLNAVLTVRAGQAASHRGMGWEQFTDRIIELLNEREKPMVFMLWGRYAKNKQSLITNPRHLVLTAAHPSPLSAYNGFFGCRHFSKANAFLTMTGQEPIDWQID